MVKKLTLTDPSEGGCWYCYTKDDNLVFCCEFDTFVHLNCIKQALEDDPNDREAQIIAKELLK